MIKRIKEYLEYRRNRKIVKRELAKIGTTALPVIGYFVQNSADVTKFIEKLVKGTKYIGKEKFIDKVIKETADVLDTTQPRLIEILQYVTTLSPEDMQKILIHSMVETMSKDESE